MIPTLEQRMCQHGALYVVLITIIDMLLIIVLLMLEGINAVMHGRLF